jgi:hypothetical protein
MKNLGLSVFILFYASFASLCFASGLSPVSITESTEAAISHHQHTQETITPSVNCHSIANNCVDDKVATVLGHAAMYDSITSVELVSFGLALLFVLALCIYCRRIFREVISYGQFIWFYYQIKERNFFFKQDLLAWSLLHTRSPNYFSSYR